MNSHSTIRKFVKKQHFEEFLRLGDLRLKTESLEELRVKREAVNFKIKLFKLNKGMPIVDLWGNTTYKKMLYDTKLMGALDTIRRAHYSSMTTIGSKLIAKFEEQECTYNESTAVVRNMM